MPTQPPTPEQVRIFLAARRLRQVRRMTEQDTTEHRPNTPA